MINIVKTISTRIANGRRLIKFLRMGLDDVQECSQIGPFGFESNPVKSLIAVYMKTEQLGEPVIVGYINKSLLTDVGESRQYSTDSDGNVVFDLIMKNDGTAEFGGSTDNMVRFSELKLAFDQLKTDHNSLVTAFNTHIHPTPSGPSSPPTPAPGIPASSSTANVDGAKIDNIKTN